MIYGLYLSATGVLANSHRQDVIANNLANSETVGFKRHLAAFQERGPESEELGQPQLSNPMLDHIGGGFLVSPSSIDTSQGELESTANPLDTAIVGKGFFAVNDNGQTRLTRNGQFMLDRQGNLVMSNGTGAKVLGHDGRPIQLPGRIAANLQLSQDGTINQNGQSLGRIGVFDVPDPSQITKQGGNLLGYADAPKSLKPSDAELRPGFVERANVDPANELVLLMETQRQLEANANMIRYQDQALGKLVSEVGRIG